MAKIPMGLQLYSVREECKKDLPRVLEAVAKTGYDGVEFAGYYDYSAEQLRKLLDDNGLICCGTHTGLPTIMGDALQATIDFNKTLGNPYLVVPGLPRERTESRAAWLETAKMFNQASERARAQDMWVGYHNHHTEFTPLDGELPWDTFFGNTVQDVLMQLDSGNALHGGSGIVQFIERYPGRALTVHLKPYSPSLGKNNPHEGFKPLIGDDEIPWAEVFGCCETVGGTKWYIVEYESDLHPPLEAVDKCLQNLRRMGK
ncbi:MAG: sugar phosphate isomerase/epimerase [Armatimonadetes bacterium]|nr:sugar phosphate isomerase/epimerase [Armatimonadota bacterium]